MSDILCCSGVSRVFQTPWHRVDALRDVNMEIREGEFVCMIGPSGSGKSTLLGIMGLLDKPTDGSVSVDGEDVTKVRENRLPDIRCRKIGFVFQTFNLMPILTARENVELPMECLGVPGEERKKRAMELLDQVELAGWADHRADELSAGQMQRVGIARAFANRPRIILADEPTGNLDARSGKMVISLLKRLNEETGTTVIVVTHDESVTRISGRVIKLRDGRIVRDLERKR